MKAKALVYCDDQFGKMDGKVTNGLVRHSEKYEIVGIIDRSKWVWTRGNISME